MTSSCPSCAVHTGKATFFTLFGFNAACFSGPIAWILADSFLIPMYYHVIHRAKRGEGIY